jgi:hypothetical protein
MEIITNQTGNTVTNGDAVAGNKTVYNNFKKETKLSSLFERLKVEHDENKTIEEVSHNLQRYSDKRDTIGLEQKLRDGGKIDILEDASWLKEQYYKKLTRFQFFEPAQEIHAFLLGLVLEKFSNIIRPMIKEGATDTEVSRAISSEIITPIMNTIQEEGCNDIMGLSSTDIDGMIYFLTGQCHIKWTKV